MELPTEELLNNENTGERDKLSTHKVLWFTVAYSSIAQSSEVIEYFSSSSCFPPVESSEDIWSEGPASGQPAGEYDWCDDRAVEDTQGCWGGQGGGDWCLTNNISPPPCWSLVV